MMGKGQVFAAWLQDIQDFIESNRSSSFAHELDILQQALNDYREIQMTLGGYLGAGKISMIGLFATRILHATGKMLGARLLLEQALIAEKQIEQLATDHYDYAFYQGKVNTAKFFARNILPEVSFTVNVIKEGDTSALDILESAFFA
jgi:hypothetical protein